MLIQCEAHGLVRIVVGIRIMFGSKPPNAVCRRTDPIIARSDDVIVCTVGRVIRIESVENKAGDKRKNILSKNEAWNSIQEVKVRSLKY